MIVTSYTFKYLLARMAFQDPARFLSTFAGEGGREYLHGLWNGVLLEEHGDEFKPTDELDVQIHHGVLLLVLPPPSERGHAIAVAVTGDKTELRVFVLERGDPAGRHTAFLAEIARRGRVNFGPWSEPELSSFATRVAELVGPNP